MNDPVWLINLYGNAFAPSAFNPDSSLAALAGSLKAAQFQPLIIDFQHTSFMRKLVPPEIGKRLASLVVDGDVSSPNYVAAYSKVGSELILFQTQLIDDEIENLVRKAKAECPLFIGFKIYSGDGSFFCRRFAQTLKQKLAIPTVAGGPLVRVLGKKYLELYDEFDFALEGEAEHSIVQFAHFARGELPITSVAELCFRDPSDRSKILENAPEMIENLEELPDPCYTRDVYPVLYEPNEKIYSFQLIESRGCYNRCGFCVHPHLSGNRSRTVSTRKIINQIKELQRDFGAFTFRFSGSSTPMKFLRDFAKTLSEERLNIRYSCFSALNGTDLSCIGDLKASGLAGLFIGGETINESHMHNFIKKKGQNRELIKDSVSCLLDHQIYVTTSWIYPLPKSDFSDRTMLKDFIIELYRNRSYEDGGVMLLPPALFPKSDWYTQQEEFGFSVHNQMQFLRNYAELSMRMWLPRQLMGTWEFELCGKSFRELSRECDLLQEELLAAGVPMAITDDWMLQGKVSGLPLSDFKKKLSLAFLSGDYNYISSIIEAINRNSKNQKWLPQNQCELKTQRIGA